MMKGKRKSPWAFKLAAGMMTVLIAASVITGCSGGKKEPAGQNGQMSEGAATPNDRTQEPTAEPEQTREPASETAEPTKAPVSEGVWDGSIADGFAGGSGTEEDPYLISNGAELAYFAKRVNDGTAAFDGEYVKLTADIRLNDTSDWESWGKDGGPANAWRAIGWSEYIYKNGESVYSDIVEHLFNGTFDGDGHTITGIYINKPVNDDADENCVQGLFGKLEDGVICNVTVDKSYISGCSSVGGIVGYLGFSATDLNVSGRLVNCRSGATVVGNGSVGGIAGLTFASEIEGCVYTGKVSGETSVGGIAGDNRGTVTLCLNYGSVKGNDMVGGIAGWNKEGLIMSCANFGSISGKSVIGGIAGDNYCETISDCYNAGNVAGGSRVGGLTGRNSGGNLSSCYNVGNVSGVYAVGGICGVHSYIVMKNCGYITNCYYLDTCGAADGIGINDSDDIDAMNGVIGGDISDIEIITNMKSLTAEAMRQAASFVGFDFEKVWTIDGGRNNGYPELNGIPNPDKAE